MGKPSTRDIVKQGRRDANLERVAGYNDGRKAMLRELIEHFDKPTVLPTTWTRLAIADYLREWLWEENSP